MARPRSDDKRNAIMDATVRVIMKQGLSAPTAEIALYLFRNQGRPLEHALSRAQGRDGDHGI